MSETPERKVLVAEADYYEVCEVCERPAMGERRHHHCDLFVQQALRDTYAHVEALLDRWQVEANTFPLNTTGTAVAAAARLCARELRDALTLTQMCADARLEPGPRCPECAWDNGEHSIDCGGVPVSDSRCSCGEIWKGHPNPHAINCPLFPETNAALTARRYMYDEGVYVGPVWCCPVCGDPWESEPSCEHFHGEASDA